MVSKSPELDELLSKLAKEKETIAAKAAPLRLERDKLRQDIAPTMDRIRELEKAISDIERPRLTEIDRQLNGLKRALS